MTGPKQVTVWKADREDTGHTAVKSLTHAITRAENLGATDSPSGEALNPQPTFCQLLQVEINGDLDQTLPPLEVRRAAVLLKFPLKLAHDLDKPICNAREQMHWCGLCPRWDILFLGAEPEGCETHASPKPAPKQYF